MQAPTQQTIGMSSTPAKQTIGMSSEATMDVDLELPPRQHLEMMSSPQHEALWGSNPTNHESVPTTSDTLYTKVLCWTCGLGEVLGNVICGSHDIFFCIDCQSDCGLGGKDGCLKCLERCELWKPEAKCCCFCKCFPIKCGLVNPLEKPFIVCNNKTVV